MRTKNETGNNQIAPTNGVVGKSTNKGSLPDMRTENDASNGVVGRPNSGLVGRPISGVSSQNISCDSNSYDSAFIVSVFHFDNYCNT